ncbi:MAG: protein kinase [Sorangiineae bacterium]|nr:protein kinase [Polyangiaceae bacterium]MEB2322209.1 protein kinase [Sorangiineae bacterium]
MQPNPGDVISGKYRIVRMIGDGGMGAVYEARHELLGSAVALKFLHSDLASRPGIASRFLQEARVSASIQSVHVTRVTDVDQTTDGSPYLVMELLSGESLQELLDRVVKLPVDQAVDFGLQMLAGLEAAHALGVVHRDLKPDNVYITPSPGGPVVKLLDFGIAKLREVESDQKGLTRPGAVMGTPEYMAPEQFYSADRVDHRADIYSLGALIYEMLTGKRPAYGENPSQLIAKVTQGQVPRADALDPSIPRGLADLVHRAMAPSPEERFASAADMRLALTSFAGALSHAGRLAATPAPGSALAPDTNASALARATVDEPALGASGPQGVAPTWPPGDAAPGADATTTLRDPEPVLAGPKGATQEAPRELMQALEHAQRAGSTPYAPPPPNAAYPTYASASASMIAPRRRKSRLGGALVALLLGVLLAGGVLAAYALRLNASDDAPPPLTTAATAPNTTITAQGGPAVAPTIAPSPTIPITPSPTSQPVAPGHTPKPTPKPDAGASRPDAGADGGVSADGGHTPPFPFTFPSALPTAFPTALPSGFPAIPIPTFPGFPQPPPQ